jgi:ribosomal protein L29
MSNIWLTPVDFKVLSSNEVSDDLKRKAIASKKEAKDKDLMYISARYVHEGENKNKDGFTSEDLEFAYTTAIYKPINIGHSDSKIVGTIYDAELVSAEESGNGKLGMKVEGVIYRWLFPKEAKLIEDKYAEGKLRVSMETWFDKVSCSVCGQEFGAEDKYCEHLESRFKSDGVFRILKSPTFAGLGIVDNPADEDAVGRIVGSDSLKKMLNKQMEVVKFEELMRLATNKFYDLLFTISYDEGTEDISSKKEQMNLFIDELKTLLDSININKIAKGDVNIMSEKNYTEDVVNTLVDKAKADVKAELETVFKEEKNGFEKEIADLKSELESLKTQKTELETNYTNLKNEIETQKLIASRKTVLAEKKASLDKFDSEKLNKVLAEMSDEAFEMFVVAQTVVEEPKEESVEENTSKEEDESEEDVPSDKTEASLKINDRDKVNSEDQTSKLRDAIRSL